MFGNGARVALRTPEQMKFKVPTARKRVTILKGKFESLKSTLAMDGMLCNIGGEYESLESTSRMSRMRIQNK